MPTVTLPTGETATFPDTMSPDQIKSVLRRKFSSQPTGVPMASASAPEQWTPGSQLPSGPNLDEAPREAAMQESRRSGWDPAKVLLNSAAFGQRPRIRAAAAAVLPNALLSDEDRAAVGRDGGYSAAKQYFEKDQAAAEEAIPGLPRAMLKLGGAVLTMPALVRALGSPTLEATKAMAPTVWRGLVRSLGGTAEAAAANVGLSAAAAPEGQVGEAAREALTSPYNALGAIPGVADAVRTTTAPWLAKRAANRAYQTVEPGVDMNAEARRFDPSGKMAVDPGKQAVGEIIRDSPILKSGMNTSEIDVAAKEHLTTLGERVAALRKAAEAKGAVPDYSSLRSELVSVRGELLKASKQTAFGPGVTKDIDDFLRRFDDLYMPKEPKLVGVGRRGVGAQVVEPTPGQRQAVAEGESLITDPVPSQPVDAPVQVTASPRDEKGRILKAVHKGDNLPPAKPVPIKRNPESAGNVTPAGLQPGMEVPRLQPGTTRPNPNSGWAPLFEEPPPVRTLTELGELKTDVHTLIDNLRAGYAPGHVGADLPAVTALRKLSGKLTAAEDAAVAAKAPEIVPEFSKTKREYGAISEAAKAAKVAAELPPEARKSADMAWILHRLGYATAGAMAGAGTGFHSGGWTGALAGGALGAAGGAVAGKWDRSGATRTRALDAMSKVAAKTPQSLLTSPEQEAALLKYLRGDH
jgi:hypothetical protein